MSPRRVAEAPFNIGDRVTIASGAVEWVITHLWLEEFDSGGIQWVAQLRGPGNGMSMRCAHLRLSEQSPV